MTNKEEKFSKNKNLLNHVYSQPKHRQISSDAEIKSLLDNYADKHPRSFDLGDKREFTEPPIPGYTGFIPKIGVTHLGLGATYNQTTRKGLTRFKNDFIRNDSNTLSGNKSLDNNDMNCLNEAEAGGKRLYVKPGMIPKYTVSYKKIINWFVNDLIFN